MTRPLLLAAAILALGCGPKLPSVGSPSVVTRPPIAAASPDEAFGHQAVVTTESAVYYGELVACDTELVYLHLNDIKPGDAQSPWVALPWKLVTSADVHTPGSSLPTTVVWSVTGALSTATHGYWFAISLPIWGVVAAPSIAWAASHQHVMGSCQALLAYARYPQGLPSRLRPLFPAPPSAPEPPAAPASAPPAAPAAPPPSAPPAAPAAPPAAPAAPP